MGMPNAPWSSRPSRSPSPTTALRLAASHMTGATRRALEAARTLHECAGHPLMAEAVLGWGRQTVALGLAERRPGLMWLGAPSAFRGRQRWEAPHPQVAQARRQLADAQAQPEPTFRTRLPDTRLPAQAALQARRDEGESEEPWPSPRTMAAVLHRWGLRVRRVVKATPPQQSTESDALGAQRKKKRLTPCHRPASTDGVSLVKRR